MIFFGLGGVKSSKRFRVFPLAVNVSPEPLSQTNPSSNRPSVSAPNKAESTVLPQPTGTIRPDGNNLSLVVGGRTVELIARVPSLGSSPPMASSAWARTARLSGVTWLTAGMLTLSVTLAAFAVPAATVANVAVAIPAASRQGCPAGLVVQLTNCAPSGRSIVTATPVAVTPLQFGPKVFVTVME